MSDTIIVLITAASEDEASRIGRTLVEEHLVACVNLLSAVRSIFFWEGKTQEASETLMICKSRMPMMDRIVARVGSLHSYSVPEIIAVPVVGGLPDYLRWVESSTQAG